jgi:ubiquitin C-terminal hydrolase
MHQDAHEFLNYLINRVVEDLEEEHKLSQEEKEREKEKNDAPTEDCEFFVWSFLID